MPHGHHATLTAYNDIFRQLENCPPLDLVVPRITLIAASATFIVSFGGIVVRAVNDSAKVQLKQF